MGAPIRCLQGIQVLSLALNMPGPAALMRCRAMGATCVKLEPPAGDPMAQYSAHAYERMHEGVQVGQANLKTPDGQQALHAELARSDVLLTSFRPSALQKLGLAWESLHARYPGLSQVAIVGAPGARAEEPGHDLTYLAENGLIPGFETPATLYADMGGSLMATEAVLQALLQRRDSGAGVYVEVPLSGAAQYLALPHQWGLAARDSLLGGGHAGYRVYACKDGRVAVAALEPHFASALCAAAGVQDGSKPATMLQASTHEAIGAFLAALTREELQCLATEKDIPLHTLAD